MAKELYKMYAHIQTENVSASGIVDNMPSGFEAGGKDFGFHYNSGTPNGDGIDYKFENCTETIIDQDINEGFDSFELDGDGKVTNLTFDYYDPLKDEAYSEDANAKIIDSANRAIEYAKNEQER